MSVRLFLFVLSITRNLRGYLSARGDMGGNNFVSELLLFAL